MLIKPATDNTPKILSGKTAREALVGDLTRIFKNQIPAVELTIIQVGNRDDSASYILAKKNLAETLGVIVHHIHLPETISQIDLITEIQKNNTNSAVKGIIVQLPLPAYLDREIVINAIDPCKDIDGLTAINIQRLSEGRPNAIVPATARGVKELLLYYGIDVRAQKVTVVGRSALVGAPIAEICRGSGAIVTVAHSKTIDLIKETIDADILIVAVGKQKLIGAKHVHPGQIVIDIGTNREDDNTLVGDVDFESVSAILGPTGAITPVPGGVGPMTVLGLFENLADIVMSDRHMLK